MSEEVYDYDGYEKVLEKQLALSEKDYWAQYVDINRHQVNVAKTYLWVSAALLGAYFTVIGKYSGYISNNSCSVLFSGLSVLSAVLAFGVCLYAIPARKGYKSIPDQSWNEFAGASHELLNLKEKNIYIKFLTDINAKADKAGNYNLQTNLKRGKLLRITSWVLIASFACASVTGITSTITISLNKNIQHEEIIMPENKESSSKESAQKPDAPKPAGPIKGSGQDRSTHSVDNHKSDTIRITESEKNSTGE